MDHHIATNADEVRVCEAQAKLAAAEAEVAKATTAAAQLDVKVQEKKLAEAAATVKALPKARP